MAFPDSKETDHATPRRFESSAGVLSRPQALCRLQKQLLQHLVHQFFHVSSIRLRQMLHRLHTRPDESRALLAHLRAQRIHKPSQLDACLPGKKLGHMLIHNPWALGISLSRALRFC